MGRLRGRIEKAEQEAGGLYQTLILEDGREVKYEGEEMLDAILAVIEGEEHPLLPYIRRMDPNKGIPFLVHALEGSGEHVESGGEDGT
jgi:hypothetical protein